MITLSLALLFTSPAPVPVPACVTEASEQYRLGDYLLAARTAELCWERSHHLRVLLVGCQARERLAHYAHAARTLSTYETHAAVDSSAWSRESAEALRNTIREHTGVLQLAVTPPPSAGELLQFALTYLDDPTREPLEGGVPELVRLGNSGFVLDAGHWSLILHRPHHEPVRHDITIALKSTTPLTVNTQRLTSPPTVQLIAKPTRLHLSPVRALRRGVELHLRIADSAAQIVRTQHDPELTLHLPPGRWQLTARARGHAPLHVTVEPGTPVELQLRPGPP